MKKLLATVLLALVIDVNAQIALPSVPGAINPNVTQSNINQTICLSGWTKTIRPPVSTTNKIKASLMKSKHLAGKMSDYELDHDISLQLGGAPIDPNNLWMQPYAGPGGARLKDAVETTLNSEVCSGKITLDHAQKVISTNWVDAYNVRYPKTPIK